MTAASGANDPGGSDPAGGEASEMVLMTPRRPKVRGLQRKLWAAAKRSPDRRFHALYDRIWRGDILQQAWELEILVAKLAGRISDRRVLKLCRKWLSAGVMEGGGYRATVAGTPQGGVISPLFSNVYLHALDQAFEAGPGKLVRYADDFVVLCRTDAEARAAESKAREVLATLGLGLHPGKTKVVDLREGREGFDFLGWHFRARASGRLMERGIRRYYLHRWPSVRVMKSIRAKVKAKTGRTRTGVSDVRVLISELNPILRGWGNYFRTGNSADKFITIDRYVTWRLRGLLVKRHGRNLRAGQADQWTRQWFRELGLHQLMGTIRYPGVA